MSYRSPPKWFSNVGPNDPIDSDAAGRLATDDRMSSVWEKLRNNGARDEDLSDFVWQVCSRLSYWEFLKEVNMLLTRGGASRRLNKRFRLVVL